MGDTLFSIGAVALGYFVVELKTEWTLKKEKDLTEEKYPKIKHRGSIRPDKSENIKIKKNDPSEK